MSTDIRLMCTSMNLKLICHCCRTTKARDFEGEGGPEDKQARFEEENPGDDSVRSNIR